MADCIVLGSCPHVPEAIIVRIFTTIMTSSTLKHEQLAPILYTFPTKDVLCEQLAEYVIKLQNSAIERRGKFLLALSGGSLPSMLAKSLVNRDDNAVRWDKWHVFFADERLVPLNHPDSNFKLCDDELFSKVPAFPRNQIHTINESLLNDAEELSDEYEKQLVDEFAVKDTVRNPVFYLILLGMGPDGHTCSLFPGHELLKEQDRWVAPIQNSPKPPPRRITLTYPVLNHAHNAVFVLSGEAKQDTLAKVLDEPQAGLPASLVRAYSPGNVIFFADEDATAKTHYPRGKFNL